MIYRRTKKLRIQFIKPTLYALKCEHNRYTVSYIFSALLQCRWPATSSVHYTTNCNTQSSAPEDG